MGVYDREYYRRDVRPQPGTYGRGGWSSVRMWSVNTWLIVICVGVFVLDAAFLPMRALPTGNRQILEPYKNIPAEMVAYSNAQPERGMISELGPDGQLHQRPALIIPLVERGTATQVGWEEVMIMHFLESYLHFSTRFFLWPHVEFWRLIGFQFLHANLSHVLFNMIGLYFFGSLVEQYLGSKRYLAFYLLCGICGAVMYLILNLGGYLITMFVREPIRIPGLLFNDPSTPLVGASAGIFGVLMAGAFIAPRELVYIFGLIPIRLQTMAYLLVGLALWTVITGGRNAGGEAGHLGGAIAGFYFIRHPYHLHNFFDFLGRADPTSHHYRERRSSKARPRSAAARNVEIDRILAKIREEGMHSLTDSEKRTLSDASREGPPQ
jgi:membrane associated rhomboid family serine protease